LYTTFPPRLQGGGKRRAVARRLFAVGHLAFRELRRRTLGDLRQGVVIQNNDGCLEYFGAGPDNASGTAGSDWARALGASNDVGGWIAEQLGSARPARPVVGWEP